MDRATQKTLKFGSITAREVSSSIHIPYAYQMDDETITTKTGLLLQVIKFDGYAFETADQDQINFNKDLRNTLIRGFDKGDFAFWITTVRRKENHFPDGEFNDGFAEKLNQIWQRKFKHKQMFVNDLYLTIIRRGASAKIGKIADIMASLVYKTDKIMHTEFIKEQHKELCDATSKITNGLSAYSPKILTTEHTETGSFSDPLAFLVMLLNGEKRKVLLPNMSLANYLQYKRIFFGKESLEIRGSTKSKFGAIISIKEYSPSTYPGMLDGFLQIPYEFILTQSFSCNYKSKAKNSLQQQQRRMQQADEIAQSQIVQINDALDDLGSGKIGFGDHHFTVMCLADDAKTLEKNISTVQAEFANLGIISVREDDNMEPCFWAQLPANFQYIARKSTISTANFASFASFHNYRQGKLKNNHWGPAVTILETTSGTPYYFSFHLKDLGNTTIIGPSGTGKTVTMSFLMAQAQRFKPQSVYFDKDRGAEIFIRALGGSYTVIKKGISTGFNPLQLPDTPNNTAFLHDWLCQLLREKSKDLSTEEEKTVGRALNGVLKLDQKHRTLRELANFLPANDNNSLGARLAAWHSKGEKSWLFDNATDSLSLNNLTIGFDLTEILDDEKARTPALMYMFHRIDSLLERGYPTIITIDEGWKALDDPIFIPRIKNWEKTIRKLNGILVFGSQSANDAINSAVGDAIIEQSPTQLFMPNLKADKAAYCTGFGLTEKEYEIIKSLPDNSHCFLIKQGSSSVIAKLDMSGMEDEIAILSGRAETVNLLDSIRAEVGDSPEDWLPIFCQRRKEL